METIMQNHQKNLSEGELSTSAELEKFIKVEDKQVSVNKGKSAVLLFFKTSSKKRSSPEPQIPLNNYITDGGLKLKTEKFKDSRDFVKKGSRLKTTTSFQTKSNKHKELTIKITEENRVIPNHTYTGSERDKKRKMKECCQTNRQTTSQNRYCVSTHNNLEIKDDEKKKFNYSAPKTRTQRKPLAIMTEGNVNCNNNQRNMKDNHNTSHCNSNDANRACTEETDFIERKKKMIEEFKRRNEQNAFYELQQHLIEETTQKKYNDLEKKINRLKENDVSINSIINKIEEGNNEEELHNQIKQETNNDQGMIKDIEQNDDNKQNDIVKSNYKTEIRFGRKFSKTHRNSNIMKKMNKPRVNVNEYLKEISNCLQSHRKSNSSYVNQYSSNNNNIKQSSHSNSPMHLNENAKDINDGNDNVIKDDTPQRERNSFRKDSKSISHSKNSSIMHYHFETKNCEENKKSSIDNDNEDIIDKSKKKVLMNTNDFEQMLMLKVIQDKEQKAIIDKNTKERTIARFIDLLKLQETIKEKRSKKDDNKNMIKNEYFTGRKAFKTNRSLSQSTIIEQSDYYQLIIQTKGILGDKLKQSQDYSIQFLNKEKHEQFNNLNTNETESNIQSQKKIKQKVRKKTMVEHLKGIRDRERNNEKDNSFARTISQELLEKVQKTVNTANLLHSNENVNQFSNNTDNKDDKVKNEKEKSIGKENNMKIDESKNTSKLVEKKIKKEKNYVDEILATDNNIEIETPKKTNNIDDIMKRIGNKAHIHHNDSDQGSKDIQDKDKDQSIKIGTISNKLDEDSLIKEEIIISNTKAEGEEEGDEEISYNLSPVEPNLQKTTSIKEEEISYNLSPVEPNLQKTTSIKKEESNHDTIDANEVRESQLQLYNQLFINFGDWYTFFIKRNIMINIVKFANTKFQYQTGVEILVEIIKREPFYQLNCYCKYMIYSLIFRGCCSHYIKKAFNQIFQYSSYKKQVQIFEQQMSLIFKFICLERINYYGEIKLELANEEIDEEKDDENNYSHHCKNNLSNNEIASERNNSSLGIINIYYQLDVLGLFISAIKNVFILPIKSHALQKIYNEAILDTNFNANNTPNSNSLIKSQNEIELNQVSIQDVKGNINNQLQFHRDTTKQSNISQDNASNASNESCSIDRTQRSIRKNNYSFLNNSEMSLRALTQQSNNKSILSISDLLRKKPGLKLRKHLDEMTTPFKSDGAIISDSKGDSSVDIPSLLQRKPEKSNTISELNDISADKDVISYVDWEEPVIPTKTNICSSQVIEDNKKLPNKEDTSEGGVSRLSKSEEVIDIKYNSVSYDNEYEKQKSVQSNTINEDKSEDNVYSNEFNQINADEIIENSENDIDVKEFIEGSDIKKNDNQLSKEKEKENQSNLKLNNPDKNDQTDIESVNSKEQKSNSVIIDDIVSIIQLNIADAKKEIQSLNQKGFKSRANNRYVIEENDLIHQHGIISYPSPKQEKDNSIKIVESKQQLTHAYEKIQIDDKVINDIFIDELTTDLLSLIMQNEVSSKDIQLLPKKKPYHKLDISLPISRSGSFGGSTSSPHQNSSKDIDFLNNSMTIYGTSVFMRSIGEIKKEVTLNLFNVQVAPLFIKVITTEIEKNYNSILNTLNIPLIPNAELLMNSYLLKDEAMKNQSKGAIPNEAKAFVSKNILKTFSHQNKEMRNENNVASDSYYDNILNECLIDATNEIIEKERYYGEVGIPLPWSIRSKEIAIKYDNDKQSVIKLQEKIMKELNDLLEMKMGLIPVNYEGLDNDQLAQDKERKFIKSIKEELLDEEPIWKSLEGEETDIKLMISRIIMEQLLNEVVEIFEHVQFSRKEPLKYQNKSIYACEDIPRLSFQNTTENENNTNENEDTINQ